MSRPSTMPSWSTNANYPAGSKDWSGQTTKVQPSAGKQAQGLEPNTDQAAEEINWLYNLIYLWIAWFDLLLFNVLSVTPPVVNVDTPQMLVKDSAGTGNRFLISHNGFPGGSINLFREEWRVSTGTVTSGTLTNNPFWFVTSAGAPTGVTTQAPTSVYPGNIAPLVTLNTLNNKLALASNLQQMHPGCTFSSWELKLDFSMDNIGANGFAHWAGFSGGKDPSSPSAGYIWFRKSSTDTNWQCECNDGATTTTVDSGVTPVIDNNGMQRMRIEYHGSATPYGANTARFFISDVLVATITTHLPTLAQYIAFANKCTTGSGTGHDSQVGTVELNVNRYATGATT